MKKTALLIAMCLCVAAIASFFTAAHADPVTEMQYLEQTDPFPAPEGAVLGDLNFDGIVNSDDLAALARLIGGVVPRLHTHSIVEHEGKAATCTESGHKPYQSCSVCGATSYVPILPLGHDWDAGVVVTPATAESNGEILYTCTRCGAEKRDVLSLKPFVIYRDDYYSIPEDVYVPTLADAISTAMSFGQQDGRYANIHMRADFTGSDVTLPAGFTLIVEKGCTLTVNSLTAEASNGELSDATVRLEAGSAYAVAGRGVILGKNGRISFSDNAEINGDFIELQGAVGEEKPLVRFQSYMPGEHVFSVVSDIDMSDFFSFTDITDMTDLQVINGAALTIEHFNCWGGRILTSDGSIDIGRGFVMGTTSGSTIKMPAGTGAFAVIENGDRMVFIGGDVEITADVFLERCEIRNYYGDAAPECTLTVRNSASVYLKDCDIIDNLVIESGSSVILEDCEVFGSVDNSGTLGVNYFVNIHSDMNNSGTFNVTAGEIAPDEYYHSEAVFEHGTLANSGTINIQVIDNEYTHRHGVLSLNGSSLTNTSTGSIINNGELRIFPRNGRFVIKGDAPAEAQGTISVPAFTNAGVIDNYGSIEISCNGAVNSGSITNHDRGEMRLFNKVVVDEYNYCDLIYSREEDIDYGEDFWNTFEDWENDEKYHIDGYTAYWKKISVTGQNAATLDGSFTNTGTITNGGRLMMDNLVFTNAAGAVITNNRELWANSYPAIDDAWWDNAAGSMSGVSFPASEFNNYGTLTIAEFSEFSVTNCAFSNTGSVTAASLTRFQYCEFSNSGTYIQLKDALELTGCTTNVTSDVIFTDADLWIGDTFYDAGGEGTANKYFTQFSRFKRNSETADIWAGKQAMIYSYEGLKAAESSGDYYNGANIRADITVDDTFAIGALRNYRIDGSYYDPNEDREKGYTLTVTGILTVNNDARLELDGRFNPDHPEENYTNSIIIAEGGKLVTAPFVPEVRDPQTDMLIQNAMDVGVICLHPNGSSLINNGTVENNGRIEFEYACLSNMPGDLSHNGALTNVSENVFNIATARNNEDLNSAISDPSFNAISVRTDGQDLIIEDDITIGSSVIAVHIDRGATLRIDNGVTFTVNCDSLFNEGTIIQEGNIDIGVTCRFENNGSLEIGRDSGIKHATMTVNGQLINIGGSINVKNTGSIVIASGGHFENISGNYTGAEPTIN